MDDIKNIKYEKSISFRLEEIDKKEVIQLLFDNMREKNEIELITISRKTLIEMSADNLHLIIQLGIINIQTLISNILESSSSDFHKSNFFNFLSLFMEIVDQNHKLLENKILKELTTFYVSLYQGLLAYNLNEDIEKVKLRQDILELVSKVLILMGKN